MTNYDNLAQPWSMSNPKQTRLPVNPNHPFYYKHWPANWDFVYIEKKVGKKVKKIGVFAPSVDMERVVPGVNGVHQLEGEIGDPSSRMGKLQQKGYVVLQPDRHDYMTVYPARYGSRYHAPKWEKIRVLAGQIIKKFDKESFIKWKIQLMIDGYLQLPEDHFIELKIIEEEKLPNRFLSEQHLPEIKKKLEEQYQRIADMKQARSDLLEKGLSVFEGLMNE